MEIFGKKEVIRVAEKGQEIIRDDIAFEKRLRILVNGKEALSLLCSPSMIRELVTGLIMTEGIIEGNWCIDRMSIEYGDEIVVDIPAEGQITTRGSVRTSGCIGGITFERNKKTGIADYRGTIEGKELMRLYREFQSISKPYQLTGCIHSAALSEGKHILIHAEDIGRHSAVDKIIGYSLIENMQIEDKVLFVSGRLSSEIAYKCSRWKIPIVASRTAPTLRAIEIAESAGITLIGFLREKRFNIYCHQERIL